MTQAFVVTGLHRGSRQPTTLSLRAADERAAGWAAIEHGIEVLSIEPVGGRPVVPPPGSTPPPLPRTPAIVRLLMRLPVSVSLACLLAGLTMVAYAAPSLPDAAAESVRVQQWYEQRRAALKSQSFLSEPELDRLANGDPSDWRNSLARARNTRDTMRAPFLWGGATVVTGGAVACLSIASIVLRRLRPRDRPSAA